MPSDLVPHYLRGFLDGHCSTHFVKGRPVIKINYESKLFLERISKEITKFTGLPLRKIENKKGTKGHSMKYTGFNQARELYNLLYGSVDVGNLYIAKSLFKMREVAGQVNHEPKIDFDIELKTLYLVHEVCCKNGLDPEKFLTKTAKTGRRPGGEVVSVAGMGLKPCIA